MARGVLLPTRQGQLVGWNRTAESTKGSINPSGFPDILLESSDRELTDSYAPTVEDIDRMVAQLPVEPGRRHYTDSSKRQVDNDQHLRYSGHAKVRHPLRCGIDLSRFKPRID